MGTLATLVPLLDIENADGYVHAAIGRTRLHLSGAQREELAAEGFLLLCELRRTYSTRHGVSFSSYAWDRLPLRLITAWHKMSGHVEGKDKDGRKLWKRRPLPASFDELLASPDFDERTVRRFGAFTRAA